MWNAKAAIFDLDGTLVKTQDEFHASAEAAVLASHGIAVDPKEISERFAGTSHRELFKRWAPSCDADALHHEKWEQMRRLAAIHPIEPIFFAKELVRELAVRGIPVAIALASPMHWIETCIDGIGLRQWITQYTSGDEVARNKPAPDIFLLAAQRLGVSPHDCVVVEDSKAGVYAALAAGMKTYWLTKSAEHIPNAMKVSSLRQLI